MGTKIVEKNDDRMVITVGAGALGWFTFFGLIGAVGILLIVVAAVGTSPGSGSSVFAGILLVLVAVFIGASYGAKIKTVAIDKAAGRIGIRSRWLPWGTVRAIELDELLEASYRYGLYSNYPATGFSSYSRMVPRSLYGAQDNGVREAAGRSHPRQAPRDRGLRRRALCAPVPQRRLLARGEGFGVFPRTSRPLKSYPS